jgi:hypothetical protein
MPRGRLMKVDILARVLRMKNDLGPVNSYSNDYKRGVDDTLNRVLDMLNEYSS